MVECQHQHDPRLAWTVSLGSTNIYAETDLAAETRALATLARKDKTPATGGWSQKPEAKGFSRSVVSQICGLGLSVFLAGQHWTCSALQIEEGHITARMFLKTYRLKDKVDGASEVACLSEVTRCAQQHGRMPIMTTGMHAPLMF
jgi:hypothetical protein